MARTNQTSIRDFMSSPLPGSSSLRNGANNGGGPSSPINLSPPSLTPQKRSRGNWNGNGSDNGYGSDSSINRMDKIKLETKRTRMDEGEEIGLDIGGASGMDIGRKVSGKKRMIVESDEDEDMGNRSDDGVEAKATSSHPMDLDADLDDQLATPSPTFDPSTNDRKPKVQSDIIPLDTSSDSEEGVIDNVLPPPAETPLTSRPQTRQTRSSNNPTSTTSNSDPKPKGKSTKPPAKLLSVLIPPPPSDFDREIYRASPSLPPSPPSGKDNGKKAGVVDEECNGKGKGKARDEKSIEEEEKEDGEEDELPVRWKGKGKADLSGQSTYSNRAKGKGKMMAGKENGMDKKGKGRGERRGSEEEEEEEEYDDEDDDFDDEAYEKGLYSSKPGPSTSSRKAIKVKPKGTNSNFKIKPKLNKKDNLAIFSSSEEDSDSSPSDLEGISPRHQREQARAEKRENEKRLKAKRARKDDQGSPRRVNAVASGSGAGARKANGDRRKKMRKRDPDDDSDEEIDQEALLSEIEMDEPVVIENRLRERNKKTTFQKELEALKKRKQAKGKKGTPGSRNNPAEAEEDSDSDAWTIRADTPDEEFIASDDDDLDRRMIPAQFTSDSHQDTEHQFKVVSQYYLYLVIIGSKFSVEASNSYFKPSLHNLRRTMQAIKDSTVTSSVWPTSFKKALETYPEFDSEVLDEAVPGCDACRKAGRVSKYLGRVGGRPYDRKTFKNIKKKKKDSSSEDEEEEIPKGPFQLGRHCRERAGVFHDITHWERTIYLTYKEIYDKLKSGIGAYNFDKSLWNKPKEDLAEGVMDWLEQRGKIKAEWEKMEKLKDRANTLEVHGQRYNANDG